MTNKVFCKCCVESDQWQWAALISVTIQQEYFLGRFEGKHIVFKKVKDRNYSEYRSGHVPSVLFWHCLQARLPGNIYWFSLKIAPFHVTFVLLSSHVAVAKHAQRSSHCSTTSCSRAGKRQPLQGYSATEHFYTMFSCANTKEFPCTCQHDYSVQCLQLNANWWSYFPTWSCGKSGDVGQRRPTILHGLPHAFSPWSGQSVSFSPQLLKNKQGVGASKEGEEKASKVVEKSRVLSG